MKILIYAIFSDNNIFLSCGDNLSIILKSLEHDTKMLLRWFNLNSLEANVEKVSINDSWKILTGKTFAIDCAVTCFCKTLLLRCLTVFRIRRSSQQRCSVKKLFLEISQNSQKNTCARVSFLKKRLWHRWFPMNFARFLRTSSLTEYLCWLLLKTPLQRHIYRLILEKQKCGQNMLINALSCR